MRELVIKALKHENHNFPSYADHRRWEGLARSLGYKQTKQSSQLEFLMSYDWNSLSDENLMEAFLLHAALTNRFL